ncbi:MAG: hypothetical protein LBP63_09225 [Prevotellaceae bacterium]|nr:hypothetical protein [Prevotellaceae bacterium]
MKKIITITLAAIASIWIIACYDALEDKGIEDDTVKNGITVKEAAEVFQQKIRSYEELKSKGNLPVNYLLPRDYTPQWDNAVFSENKYVWSIEAPIISSSQLKTSHTNEKQPWSAVINQKVVVIKSKKTQNTELFVLSLIPDKECFTKHRSRRERLYTHLGNTNKFSGTVVYTLWEGTNIAINEHTDKNTKRKFTLKRDKHFAQQKNLSKNVIDSTGEMVLLSGDGPAWWDDLPESVVIGYPAICDMCGAWKIHCRCPDYGYGGGGSDGYDGYYDGDEDYEPPPYVDPFEGGSGGGGNGNGDDEDDEDDEEEPPIKYTVTISIAGNGTATGEGEYNSGTSVTLTATSNTNYSFVGWIGDYISNSANLTFTITQNTNVTAIFQPKYAETWTMDDKTRSELVPAFNLLYSDCAGKRLIDNIPNGFSVKFDPSTQYLAYYKASTNSITWFMHTVDGVEMQTLFHEFFHAYQRKNDAFVMSGGKVMNLMNIETEANIAAYKYVKKHGIDDATATWHIYWNKEQRKDLDRYLANPTLENYNIILNHVCNMPEHASIKNRVVESSKNTNIMNQLFQNCY